MATAPATKLTLPTEATAGNRDWRQQRFTIIGKPGVGKSTLWSHGAATLYVDSEGTIGHLAVKRLPCRSMAESREIHEALMEAAAAGRFPYDTIVFDTLDKVVDAAEQEVLEWGREKFKRVSIEAIGDIPEGGGYSKLAKGVMSMLDAWDALPAAIVLVTHPKQVEIKDPAGADFDKETIAMFPSIANRVLGWSHHNLHVQSRWVGTDLKRVVRTKPERTIEAKSHGGIVPDKWTWETADLRKEYEFLRGLFT